MNEDDVQPVEPAEEPASAPPPKPRKAKAKVKAKGNGKAAKPVKAAAKPAKRAAKASPAKAKAAKPRQRDPSKLDQYGYRKGTTRSLAAALYATKRGATLAETKERFGTTQFNVLTELKARGHKISERLERSDKGRTVKRFNLTPKAA